MGDIRNQYWKIIGFDDSPSKEEIRNCEFCWLQNVVTGRNLCINPAGLIYTSSPDQDDDNQFWRIRLNDPAASFAAFQDEVSHRHSESVLSLAQIMNGRNPSILIDALANVVKFSVAEGRPRKVDLVNLHQQLSAMFLMYAVIVRGVLGREPTCYTISCNAGASLGWGIGGTVGLALDLTDVDKSFLFYGANGSAGLQIGPGASLELGAWENAGCVPGPWMGLAVGAGPACVSFCAPLGAFNITGVAIGLQVPSFSAIVSVGYWCHLNSANCSGHQVTITTGSNSTWTSGDGTSNSVYANLIGDHGSSGYVLLDTSGDIDFNAGSTRTYAIACGNIGNVSRVKLKLDGIYLGDEWRVVNVTVKNPITNVITRVACDNVLARGDTVSLNLA
jgi:hypothetical protein